MTMHVGVLIPSANGVGLPADIGHPAASTAGPVVLVRTPYNRAHRISELWGWTHLGFRLVVQDLPGRGDAHGQFSMRDDHRVDGHHAIDWIIDQPWCDGRVVCFGLGFEALTALGLTQHRSVVAVIAQQPYLENGTFQCSLLNGSHDESPVLLASRGRRPGGGCSEAEMGPASNQEFDGEPQREEQSAGQNAEHPLPLESMLAWRTDRGVRNDRPETFDLLDQDRAQTALLQPTLHEIGLMWPAPLVDWPPDKSNTWTTQVLDSPLAPTQSTVDTASPAGPADPPQLHLGSWFCHSAETSISLASRCKIATLIMGPWVSNLTHRLSETCVLNIEESQVYDPIDVAINWLQPILDGVQPTLGAHSFVLGSNRWVPLDITKPSAPVTRKLFAEAALPESGHRSNQTGFQSIEFDPPTNEGLLCDIALSNQQADELKHNDQINRVDAQLSKTFTHTPSSPFPSLRHSEDHAAVADRTDVARWKTHSSRRPIAWAGSAQIAFTVSAEPVVQSALAPANRAVEPGLETNPEESSPVAGLTSLVITFLCERASGERFRIVDTARTISLGISSLVIAMPSVVVELAADDALLIEITGARFPRYSTAAQANNLVAQTGTAVQLTITPSPLGFVRFPAPPPPADAVPDGASAQLQQVVDERTGIVTAVRPIDHWPGVPQSMNLWAGEVSDVDRYLGWPADRVSMGMAVGNAARAWNGAVGEAIERYCGNFVPNDLTTGTFEELQEFGFAAIDPTSLALYSRTQYEDPSCPFTEFTKQLSIRWTQGRWLRSTNSVSSSDTETGDAVLVPASLVWVNYHLNLGPREPITNSVNLAGLAAGPDRETAELSALEEIIERDASMIWWHSGGSARPIVFDDESLHLGIVNVPEKGAGWFRLDSPTDVSKHWMFRAVAIPTTFNVSVIGVLLCDSQFGIHGLGIAARPNPIDALSKALTEAVSLQSYAYGLLEGGGDLWELGASGRIDLGALKEPLPDRSYRKSYRADFRDVRDLSCHSQIWLDPEMTPFLAPIVDELTEPIRIDDMPTIVGDSRNGYLDRIASVGLAACSVDVTTSDVASTGLCVVRVVVPGAYSNPPAAFPLLGGTRLYTDPVTLGLRKTAATSAELVLAPIPHT